MDEGSGARPGRFRYDVATGAWLWDDQVYRIHGYLPGEVAPTTDLILRHKHKGDRERVRAVLSTRFEQAAHSTCTTG